MGVLGRGGFGAVYAAEHVGTRQPIAIKMLLSASEAGTAEVRRFHREAEVTARLRHPNTVRVFDVGQTASGAMYIAMERLHGPTLEEVLRDNLAAGRTLSERDAVNIGISVLKSLSEAHGQGLVHRDLKPANIMLTDIDGELVVKVLDFGIARLSDSSLTGEGTALGTPAYMSPEQCRGADLDGRSDVYSLGIILFRCVTGVTPFADPNPLVVLFRHATEPLPDLRTASPSALSDEFVAIVTRALAKRREDRFADARVMRDALTAIQGGALPVLTAASMPPASPEQDAVRYSTQGGDYTLAAVADGDESKVDILKAAFVTTSVELPVAAPGTQSVAQITSPGGHRLTTPQRNAPAEAATNLLESTIMAAGATTLLLAPRSATSSPSTPAHPRQSIASHVSDGMDATDGTSAELAEDVRPRPSYVRGAIAASVMIATVAAIAWWQRAPVATAPPQESQGPQAASGEDAEASLGRPGSDHAAAADAAGEGGAALHAATPAIAGDPDANSRSALNDAVGSKTAEGADATTQEVSEIGSETSRATDVIKGPSRPGPHRGGVAGGHGGAHVPPPPPPAGTPPAGDPEGSMKVRIPDE